MERKEQRADESEQAETERPERERDESKAGSKRAKSKLTKGKQAKSEPAETDQAETDQAEREPSAANDTWDRLLLTTRGGTSFYAAVDDKPFLRPVDLIVLPAGPTAERGNLARALDEHISADQANERLSTMMRLLQERAPPRIDPDTPLVFPLPAGAGLPPFAAHATCEGPNGDVTVDNAAIATAAVIDLAAKQGLRRVNVPLVGAGLGALDEGEVVTACLRALLVRPAIEGVDEITFTSPSPVARVAAEALMAGRAQSFSNDLVGGADLLNVDAEVSALAETLLLREVEPPLVAGIFGGWGSGKSFAMHLMQKRMAEIRALPIEEADAWPEGQGGFPWVGHVYVVRFDAWTFAKSNLWASLMQTIFRELNHKLTLEAQLSGKLKPVNDKLGEEEERDKLAATRQRQGGKAYGDLVMESASDPFASALAKGEDQLWKELQRQKEEQRRELAEREEKLADKRKRLAEARAKLERTIEDDIEKSSRDEAWRALEGALKDKLGPVLDALRGGLSPSDGDDGIKAGPAAEALLSHPESFLRTVWSAIQMNWAAILATLAITLGAAVAAAVAAAAMGGEKRSVPIAVATSLVGAASAAWRTASKWYRMINESRAAFDRHVAMERDKRRAIRDAMVQAKLEAQRHEAQRHEATKTAKSEPAKSATADMSGNVPMLEREVEELASHVERQRQRVGLTASFVSLAQFVSARLEQQAYEKELGLVHQVQQDLYDLTEGLSIGHRDTDASKKHKHALFPRGPARVILFIDDLDRCPPAKVVEVLEAAQLLVKTRLFVVVLAMDERFITRALEKIYEGVLHRHGDPSGLDFIEKIVQIPYRVRRIRGEAVSRYLSAQMRVVDEQPDKASPGAKAPPPEAVKGPPPGAGQDKPKPKTQGDPVKSATGAEGAGARGVLPRDIIAFSRQEFEDLAAACDEIGLTPRAVKRLVNVYKLLKIIWYRPNGYPSPARAERRIIVSLLALTARAPLTMRRFLEELAPEIGASNEGFAKVARDKLAPLRAELPPRDIELIHRCADKLTVNATPKMVSKANYQLLQSFCFIGDIGREADVPYAADASSALKVKASSP